MYNTKYKLLIFGFGRTFIKLCSVGLYITPGPTITVTLNEDMETQYIRTCHSHNASDSCQSHDKLRPRFQHSRVEKTPFMKYGNLSR